MNQRSRLTWLRAEVQAVFPAGLLLLLGIASGKLSAGFGLPAPILFLVLEMLAGEEGIGGIAESRCPNGLSQPWRWKAPRTIPWPSF